MPSGMDMFSAEISMKLPESHGHDGNDKKDEQRQAKVEMAHG